MPRREASARNEVKIYDNLSGCEVALYYRTPTTSEIQGYANMSVERHRNKIRSRVVEARLKYGLQILTGVREGDFERAENGRHLPFASEPSSPAFWPQWKEWMEVNAADLVMLLAAHVFDASAEIRETVQEDEGEEAEGNSPETSPA